MTVKEEVAKILNAFIEDASGATTATEYADFAYSRLVELKNLVESEAPVGTIPEVPA